MSSTECFCSEDSSMEDVSSEKRVEVPVEKTGPSTSGNSNNAAFFSFIKEYAIIVAEGAAHEWNALHPSEQNLFAPECNAPDSLSSCAVRSSDFIIQGQASGEENKHPMCASGCSGPMKKASYKTKSKACAKPKKVRCAKPKAKARSARKCAKTRASKRKCAKPRAAKRAKPRAAKCARPRAAKKCAKPRAAKKCAKPAPKFKPACPKKSNGHTM